MTHTNAVGGVGNDYLFSSREEDEVRERLRLLEEITDPATIRRFEQIGVREGWSCLEVAAGAGSIAAWLGNRVGPGGRVLAVDIDTRFLGDLSAPVELRALNVLTDDLGSGFDLVHGRAILMHLRDPEIALKKMAAAVKPGGWLLIEEKDRGSAVAFAGHPEAELVNERRRSGQRKAEEAGLDPQFGRRVRSLVEGLGFEEVVADGDTRIWRGGEGARFAELTNSALHGQGLGTDEDHDQMVRLMRDPSFTFTDGIQYGAWGRRPS